MKTIILPTDFSDSARKACEYALNLFKDEPVNFILLNSYVMPASSAEMLISLNDVLRQSSVEGLQHEREYLASRYPAQANYLQERSEHGYLENVLLRIVRNEPIHMIIMGTTGASGFKKFFFGSNATTVLRNVDAPILTIPNPAVVKKPKTIALALDNYLTPSSKTLAPLMNLVERFDAELRPVHIHHTPVAASTAGTEPIEASEAVNTQVMGRPLENIYAEKVLDGLHNFITENDIDMVVMIHRNRSFLSNLFHSSNTREMAMLSTTPLLVLPEQD